MRTQTLLAVAASLAAGAGALAVTELQIDINSLRAQARFDNGAMGFGGVNHTGSIQLTHTGTSNLAGVLIDGAAQAVAAGLLMSFSGQIDLVNGGVTGGFLNITLNNGDSFTSQIQGGIGQVQFQAGQGFSIDGLTTNGLFSSASFAGVNITPWFNDQPLNGAFINFSFSPNGMGRDNDTDIDIFLPADEDRPEIPAPLAGSMAGAALLGLAARRRR